jgi:N-acetyl-gamma-glutamylphosphate reductase
MQGIHCTSDAPFVEIVAGTPRLKSVVASNVCQIGVAGGEDTVVVMSVIDNLVKGAAGGAVQWMNRLWGLPETTGLTAAAPGWT